MTSREKQILEELQRLDPQLAGLFRQGLECISRAHEPGGIYMLSHAGRELSAAIIRLLSDQGEPLTAEENDRVPGDEGHRRTIAQALGLGVQHPSVTTWMRTHKALQETAHYRAKAPSPEAIQRTIDALHVLTDILFGRIGLYFDARREIDDLLEREAPTAADVDRARALVLRPQLRRAFFHKLRHIGWLEPLRQTNLFREAPDLGVDPETGEPRALPWPEGEYLVNIAPDDPDRVVEVLIEIPDGLRNPNVWHAVAEAALRLPATHGARLVPKLARALAQTGSPAVARVVLSVAEHLASEGQGAAIDLLRELLHVGSGANTETFRATPTGEMAALPRMRHTARTRDFLALIEKIAALRPRATVADLCNRLNRMLQIEHGDPSGQEAPVPDYSRIATRTIDEGASRAPVALVAAAVLRAAQTAVAHQDAGPEWVLGKLSRYPWYVFRRLRLALLAGTPVFDQAVLDAAIGAPALLEMSPVLPEYRQLILAHFSDASPDTQEGVIQQILHGPSEATMERLFGPSDGGEADGDEMQAFRAHWQRHRLRLFGDAPPPQLEALAKELGTVGEVLSRYERDLDEVGFATRIGGWGGPESPLSLEEIRPMSTEEVFEYLKSFVAGGGPNDPTPAALASVLAQRVTEDPFWAAPLLESAASADLDATYVRGLLEGLVAAVGVGQQIPWREALGLVADIASRPTEFESEGWAWRTAADLLSACASEDRMPADYLDGLWYTVDALLRADATWAGGTATAASIDDVLTLDLSVLSGRATEALFEVALYDYRLWERVENRGGWGGRERLRLHLEEILERRIGEATLAARSVLGRCLPQLIHVDPEWVRERWDALFGAVVEAPLLNPVFASYLAQVNVYHHAFEVLRPLYERAVEETAREANFWTVGEESARLGRYLLAHLFAAYQGGLLELPQDGELLDRAFTNAHPDDASNVWWGVFRQWADAEEPIPEEQVRRVIDLWGWRLASLEEAEGAQRRAQEAKGFGWLPLTDVIADEVMLPLLLRSVRLSAGEVPIAGDLWERLSRMALLDARTTVEIASLVIGAELAGEFPHFNVPEVAPVLRAGLHADDPEARELAERTIHTLGEYGFEQFGQLLREEDEGSSASE